MKKIITVLGLISSFLSANPYPDPRKVPIDSPSFLNSGSIPNPRIPANRVGSPVVRIELNWTGTGNQFQLGQTLIENSGTPAFVARSKKENPLGSYKAQLIDRKTSKVISYDSIGTGMEFRKLTRTLTFRFPKPKEIVELRVMGENPDTGTHEALLDVAINPNMMAEVPLQPNLETLELRPAQSSPELVVAIYADGYLASRKEAFFKDASKVVKALENNSFPEQKRFHFVAVFAPSSEILGDAKDLGMPVKEKNTFLGLFFPYWDKFGRWYHIVYPTRETKYRNGLAQVPYDYPIALLDDSAYWGVGNFNEITAIPAQHSSFTYLLMHEFGHYFGLNEEYEGGGATELQFAPEIPEPWSQNITFLKNESALKWKHLIAATTPIPTPSSHWTGSGPYGAYEGGYADSEPLNHSHKPGFSCTMSSGSKLCPICVKAISEKINFDLGLR